MAEPGETPAGIRCAACGFENAAATLYCQDCGAKLEIPAPSYLRAAPLPAAEAAEPAAPPLPATARKPRILSTHRRRPVLGFVASAFNVLLGLAALAVLGLIVLPPSDLPPPSARIDAQTLGEIRFRVGEAARRGETSREWPWERLNAYLASVLVPTGGDAAVSSTFVRAILQPRPGGFSLVVEKTVLGLPIYTTVRYRLLARDRSLTLVPTGAAIGRLPLPASAASAVEHVGGDLAGALDFELNLLRTARTVRLSPSGVQIGFGPAPLRP